MCNKESQKPGSGISVVRLWPLSVKEVLCEGDVCVLRGWGGGGGPWLLVYFVDLKGLGFRHGTRQGVFSPSVSGASVLLVCGVRMREAARMCWCAGLTRIAINVK